MKKRLLATVFLLLLVLALAGCAPAAAVNYQKGNFISGRVLDESSPAEQDTGLTLRVQSDKQPVGILVRGVLTRGRVFVSLKDPAGAIVWSSQPVGGSFNQNGLVDTLKVGRYRLFMAWDGPVQGQLDVFTLAGEALQLPQVSPLGLLAGVGMLLVGFVYLFYAARRRLGWRYMGLGALAWLAAVLVKLLAAFLANGPLYRSLVGSSPATSLPALLFDLYVGALTGVCEVWLVWLFVARLSRIDKTSWQKALAFGIGFGVVEALLLGLASLGGMLFSMLNENSMPLATLQSFSQTANLFYDLAPISERFFTILVHIFSNLLIFYAVYRSRQGWMWLAFVYKTLFDSVAAYAQLSGILVSIRSLWLVELVIMLFGLAGWFGLSRILPLYSPPPLEPQPVPAADGSPAL